MLQAFCNPFTLLLHPLESCRAATVHSNSGTLQVWSAQVHRRSLQHQPTFINQLATWTESFHLGPC